MTSAAALREHLTCDGDGQPTPHWIERPMHEWTEEEMPLLQLAAHRFQRVVGDQGRPQYNATQAFNPDALISDPGELDVICQTAFRTDSTWNCRYVAYLAYAGSTGEWVSASYEYGWTTGKSAWREAYRGQDLGEAVTRGNELFLARAFGGWANGQLEPSKQAVIAGQPALLSVEHAEACLRARVKTHVGNPLYKTIMEALRDREWVDPRHYGSKGRLLRADRRLIIYGDPYLLAALTPRTHWLERDLSAVSVKVRSKRPASYSRKVDRTRKPADIEIGGMLLTISILEGDTGKPNYSYWSRSSGQRDEDPTAQELYREPEHRPEDPNLDRPNPAARRKPAAAQA